MKAETRSLQFNMSQVRNGAIQVSRRVENMRGAVIQINV